MDITRRLRKIGFVTILFCYGLYSLPGLTAITSCQQGTIIGGPFVLNTLPTKMTNGFILASRSFSTPFIYTKTGTTIDSLYIGAWFAGATPDSTYNTVPIRGSAQGVGYRVYNKVRHTYADNETFNILNILNTAQPGVNLSFFNDWVIELVVVNASIYKGGSVTGTQGSNLSIVFGNSTVWEQKNTDNSGTRCSTVYPLYGLDVLTAGGGGSVPELPVPKTPTCDLSGTNITVPLPDVDSSTLKNSGDISGSKSFSIPLGNCGKDAKPYITFTDSNNKSNRSTILGLASSSTAAGVGIVIEKSSGDFVQFGAQNTGVNSSNLGQFLIGTSDADGSSLPLNLTAKYIRTNNALKAGEIKADAIFTIAYP